MNQFNKNEVYLFPAYGIRYSGFAEVLNDWNERKDFSIYDLFYLIIYQDNQESQLKYNKLD